MTLIERYRIRKHVERLNERCKAMPEVRRSMPSNQHATIKDVLRSQELQMGRYKLD